MAAQIPESDQIKQFKEFLGTYNKLTETCFLDCVKDFTTREVKPEEVNLMQQWTILWESPGKKRKKDPRKGEKRRLSLLWFIHL
ncbi:mitochondrial import inner membrane translocase subunit Tim9 isoform X2 [Macaca nemestrina]|uniref:mitochondrial import inner membrane translocase subunit Tim9 isoform X2 n=1 Tax=Macaca nemestrina TaxID=9545 RepID=UPI0039B85BCE